MKEIINALKEQNIKLQSIEDSLFVIKSIFNIDELVEYTRLSKSTIYKYTHNGTIPFYKKANHLWFDKKEIDFWIKSNKGYSSENTSIEAANYVTLNPMK